MAKKLIHRAWLVLTIGACSPSPVPIVPKPPTSVPAPHPYSPPDAKSPGGFALWNVSSPSAGANAVRVSLLAADGKPVPQSLPDVGAEGWPVWSPDGWRLATLVGPSAATTNAVHIVEVATGKRRVLLDDGRFHGLTRWSPSGRFITLHSSDPVAINDATADAKPPRLDRIDVDSGETRTLAPTVFAETWVVGSDAMRVVVRTQDGWTTSLFDAAGGESPPAKLSVPADTREVFPSPDGARVAFVRKVAGQRQNELATCALDGSELLALGTIWRFGDLVWSPDGAHLAYTRIGAGSARELWVASGGQTKRVAAIDEFDDSGEIDPSQIAWSPDSTKLATLSVVGTFQSALLIAANDGTAVHELTRIDGAAGGLVWRP